MPLDPIRSHTHDTLAIRGPLGEGFAEVLVPEALELVAALSREFGPRITELLAVRDARQLAFDAGERPTFLPETRVVRDSDWQVAPIPDDLLDRRVEITGPVERKMIINALNSGASVFMADFEDSSAPTWANVIDGQLNLRDAVRRTITFDDPARGKHYELGRELATLMVRPRGLHLREAHLELDGQPVPAALVDFGLFMFHNARELLARGSAPYFYVPKLQSHLEARLWNDVFVHAQAALGIPRGTIRATVLIETLPAVFEMDEILFELREHSAGLNCGRWDYIFSFIKTFAEHASFVLPDRGQVGMTQPNMRAYTQLLIRTCHRRGVHAIGGMAAQIPIKDDPSANQLAIEKVREDKRREAQDGHDGTWVAHPGLVDVARSIFDAEMTGLNQIDRKREDVEVGPADLVGVPQGTRTENGLRHNIRVGIQYLESWLRGRGCVPLYNLMEDAATAEISRAQVWQWIHHGAVLESGQRVTAELVHQLIHQELVRIRFEVSEERFDSGQFPRARELFEQLATAERMSDFLTLPAYDFLVTTEEPLHRG